MLAAEKARDEMSQLTSNNEKIIAQAKVDRDVLLKEAREMKSQIISQAKDKAVIEAEKLVNSAKEQISNEKMKALTELKNHVADLSIEMAEKVLLFELSDSEKQKELVNTALKENNNCIITESSWVINGDCLVYKISANRFLHHMVRMLVGTMVEVSKGRLNIDTFYKMVRSENLKSHIVTCPSNGLYLNKVNY